MFLARMADRAAGAEAGVRLRRPSRFEPAMLGTGPLPVGRPAAWTSASEGSGGGAERGARALAGPGPPAEGGAWSDDSGSLGMCAAADAAERRGTERSVGGSAGDARGPGGPGPESAGPMRSTGSTGSVGDAGGTPARRAGRLSGSRGAGHADGQDDRSRLPRDRAADPRVGAGGVGAGERGAGKTSAARPGSWSDDVEAPGGSWTASRVVRTGDAGRPPAGHDPQHGHTSHAGRVRRAAPGREDPPGLADDGFTEPGGDRLADPDGGLPDPGGGFGNPADGLGGGVRSRPTADQSDGLRGGTRATAAADLVADLRRVRASWSLGLPTNEPPGAQARAAGSGAGDPGELAEEPGSADVDAIVRDRVMADLLERGVVTRSALGTSRGRSRTGVTLGGRDVRQDDREVHVHIDRVEVRPPPVAAPAAPARTALPPVDHAGYLARRRGGDR